MARFDYYPGARGKGYLLDCQSDWLEDFGSRVVVPLLPVGTAAAVNRLNPIFEIGGESYVMSTQLIFAIPYDRLGQRIGSLATEHLEIVSALDTLIGSY